MTHWVLNLVFMGGIEFRTYPFDSKQHCEQNAYGAKVVATAWLKHATGRTPVLKSSVCVERETQRPTQPPA